jgi:hypothetical protein
MDGTALLVDGFERVRGTVHDALEGISTDELNARPDKDSNSVAWLIWHLTRIQDDHVADLADLEQVWHARGYREKFDLPLPGRSTGFGHSPSEVAAVRVESPDLLLGYFDAVHDQTVRHVRGLDAASLDEVVDEGWQPPVTRGVRLVSVLCDDLQHGGQAAYLRGLLRRR